MKKIFSLSLSLVAASLITLPSAFAQTNALPSSGSVGVGTTSPADALEVRRPSGNMGIRITNDGNGSGDYAALRIYQGGSEKGVIYTHSEDMIINRSGSGSLLLMLTGGNVGIGTTTPDYKLDVNGTMRAKEVIVESGWADFVFEDGYVLRSLGEVEAHIDEHGHLPDVPSAAVIQKEGLEVAKAQTIMMQKIEELTLYAIEQEKRVGELEEALSSMAEVNRRLMHLLEEHSARQEQ